VAYRAPGLLLSSLRLATNPLVRSAYWNVAPIDGNTATLPCPHHWPVQEVLDEVRREIADQPPRAGKYRLLIFTALHEWMSGDLYDYKLWQMGLRDRVELTGPPAGPPQAEGVLAAVTANDFLVLHSGRVCKTAFDGVPKADQVQLLANYLAADDYRVVRQAGFVLLAHYPLPDGSEASLWRAPRPGDSRERFRSWGSEWQP
jgi:hypothetical protein